MEQSAIASGGRRHTASLAMRLAFSVALVLVVGGTVVALAAFAYGRQAAQQAFDRLLIGAADQIAGSISIQGGRVLVDIPASAFELLALAPDDRLLYAVLDPVEDPFVLAVRKGHPLAERERLTWADRLPSP